MSKTVGTVHQSSQCIDELNQVWAESLRTMGAIEERREYDRKIELMLRVGLELEVKAQLDAIELAASKAKAEQEKLRKILDIRQLRILKLVMQGYTSKEIAESMNIKTRTLDRLRQQAMMDAGAWTLIDLVHGVGRVIVGMDMDNMCL